MSVISLNQNIIPHESYVEACEKELASVTSNGDHHYRELTLLLIYFTVSFLKISNVPPSSPTNQNHSKQTNKQTFTPTSNQSNSQTQTAISNFN